METRLYLFFPHLCILITALGIFCLHSQLGSYPSYNNNDKDDHETTEQQLKHNNNNNNNITIMYVSNPQDNSEELKISKT